MSTNASRPAAALELQVREIPEGHSRDEFIELSWTVNARDPQWVAPLRMSLRGALDRSKHPFHNHAQVAYFVARRGDEPVGRVAAIVNQLHNEFQEDRTGFFGLFEAVDDPEVAAALLEAAEQWLRDRGMDRMRGPVNFSTNEEIASPGVLVEGFDTPPMAMMSHNPPYYERLMEGAGLARAKDLLAFWLDDPDPPERLVRGMERVVERMNAVIRPLDLNHFQRDVDVIKGI